MLSCPGLRTRSLRAGFVSFFDAVGALSERGSAGPTWGVEGALATAGAPGGHGNGLAGPSHPLPATRAGARAVLGSSWLAPIRQLRPYVSLERQNARAFTTAPPEHWQSG